MTANSRFDIDAVMKTVGSVAAKYPEESPENEALRIVSVALLYVREIQKLEEYREYFQKFSTYKPVTIVQAFATREEGDKWLASGEAKDGNLVKIAGQAFIVINALKGLKFVPTHLPEDIEGR